MALYQRGDRRSGLRTLEFGAGIGLAALGAGHSPMIGQALARGVRMAQSRDSSKAIDALRLAQAAQGALRRGTATTERQLRQVQVVDRAVRAVPAPLRGDVATAAGVLLAGNALPLHDTVYRPVTVRVRVPGVNW